jgi:hypothetical protein
MPILSNGDGYYYLRFARDVAEGDYDAVDAGRRFPDRPDRPSPPPLLSVLAAAIHKASGAPLDWVAVLIPVLIAPLLLLPIYGLARATGGGTVMGLGAALLAVVSEYYAGRTRIGVFDTDCLIVTLTLGVCYFVYRFATETSHRRYVFAAAGAVGYAVFYWWWDTATVVASAICLSMFAVAVAFFYRPSRREGWIFAGAVAAVLAAVVLWRGGDAPVSLIRGVVGTLTFVGGKEEGPFPSTVGNIRELQVLGFAQTARLVAGGSVVFLLGCAGFLWWMFRRGKRALLFIVIALLAVLPALFGNRFLIFQVPVVAMGVGFLLERLSDYRARWAPVTAVVVILALIPAVICFRQTSANLFRSPMARSMSAVQAVADNTPRDAVVWSTFWHGYPILYYARRAAITDAGTLEGPRLVYQNVPLASPDPRLSANFMQFWVARGSLGMDRLYDAAGGDHTTALRILRAVCASGPESARSIIAGALRADRLRTSADLNSPDDWLRFFFPPRTLPIFLLLTPDLSDAMVWFERGTWDPSKRAGLKPYYRAFSGVRRTGDLIRGPRSLVVDEAKGTLRYVEPDGRPTTQRLSRVVTATAEGPDVSELGGDGLAFEWIPAKGFGVSTDKQAAGSLYHRMFIRHETDSRFFRPISLETPSHQLWEVRGDVIQ